MGRISNIIIHCSDSTFGCAREIRRWHLARGWRDIGYHFVIQNGRPVEGLDLEALDGSVECGRDLDEDLTLSGSEVGAHAFGYNSDSIGVCLVGTGEAAFTEKQACALAGLVLELCGTYGVRPDNVLGHSETESGRAQGKTCPGFDVAALRETLKSEMRR